MALAAVREGQAVEERGCWEREQRERGRERKDSHEAAGPGGFSLAESSVNGVQADWEKHEMDTWEGKGS